MQRSWVWTVLWLSLPGTALGPCHTDWGELEEGICRIWHGSVFFVVVFKFLRFFVLFFLLKWNACCLCVCREVKYLLLSFLANCILVWWLCCKLEFCKLGGQPVPRAAGMSTEQPREEKQHLLCRCFRCSLPHLDFGLGRKIKESLLDSIQRWTQTRSSLTGGTKPLTWWNWYW